MNFPEIPEFFTAVLQLIALPLILYSYFKNKKNKVEEDPLKGEYSVAIGIGAIAFIICSVAVIAFVFGEDNEGTSRAINSMKWISWILLVIGFSYVEYRFWKKKKRRANEPEIKNQDSL